MLKKSTICVCLVVFMGSWGWAADQDVLECVDDLAYGAIRLDVRALDFSRSVDALLDLAGKTLEARKVQHLKKGVARSRHMMESDLTAFQQAGGREIYAIFSLRDIPACFLVFPVDPGVDQARLKSEIQSVAQKTFHIRDLSIQSHGRVILAGKTQAVEAARSLSHDANPLWVSLLDTKPSRALRFVIVPTPMQLRVLREMWPIVTDVPGMDQLNTLVQNCQWVTLSAQVIPDMAVEAALQMQTKELADQVAAFWKVVVPLMAKPLQMDVAAMQQITMVPQGRKVAWSINHSQAQQVLGKLLLLPVQKMATHIEHETCMTNMSGIGKANLIYANDHNDQCPPDLETLMDRAQMPENCAMSQKGLICPATGIKGSYGYCADGLDVSCEPTIIVAYDRKGNHAEPGRSVVFLDSHSEWVTEEYFQELMAKVNAVRKERGLEELAVE